MALTKRLKFLSFFINFLSVLEKVTSPHANAIDKWSGSENLAPVEVSVFLIEPGDDDVAFNFKFGVELAIFGVDAAHVGFNHLSTAVVDLAREEGNAVQKVRHLNGHLV